MSDIEEKLKQELDIVETISQYTKLEQKGKYYWGCCPCHEDLKPSMSVNPERKQFKCFACGVNGDVITFLANINHKSRKDMIDILAKEQ